jgi:NitT/TauT family transport system substrate-binding protein
LDALPSLRRLAAWMGAALLALSAPMHGAAAADTKISLMVGGVEKQIYLPVILASRLGYFREQGLDVEVLTEPSGVDAEDELLAGAVQGVVGFYDHTIDLQAKGKLVKSVVQFSKIPGEVLLASTRHRSDIRTAADLRDRTLGVTGLGSSTNWLVRYLTTTEGLKTNEIRSLAVGAGESFIAAMDSGRIAAGMTTEPTASRLLSAGQASVLVDLRSVAGTRRGLGGLYPAACLYMRESWINAHRPAVRKLADALVKALHYLQSHDAQEIAAQVPAAYYAGDERLYVKALADGREMFTVDGRMPADGPATVLKVLQAVNPHVRSKTIDLQKTYTQEFVSRP